MSGPRSQAKVSDQRWMKKVRCPPEHLILFLKQLSIMLNTGVPLIVALETLSHQEEHPNFGEAIIEMAQKVGQGHTLSSMLGKFPRLFNGVHVAMVTTGERTGALASSLERVATWGERDNRLYRDVKAAFTYPAVVMVVAFILTLILFLTVIPGFVTMFEERGMELPLITQIVVMATKLLTNPGTWLMGSGLAVLAYFSFREFLRTPEGALEFYRLVTFIPIVGDLIVTASAARYSSVLGTLLDSGLGLLDSLRLGAEASGSPLFKSDARRLALEVQNGQNLAEGMRGHPEVYPNLVTEMVAVGEETSSLSEMYFQASRFLDEEVSYRVETLSAALEPLMLVSVSVLVGGILLAIILPLYGFLNQLGA